MHVNDRQDKQQQAQRKLGIHCLLQEKKNLFVLSDEFSLRNENQLFPLIIFQCQSQFLASSFMSFTIDVFQVRKDPGLSCFRGG